MAKGTSKAWSLDFHDMEGMIKRYEKIGASIQPATEKCLKKTQEFVVKNLDTHTTSTYFPAKGKYSTGDTKKSIYRDDTVHWVGTMGYIGVGYDVSQDKTSIFLMYGTPKMRKVKQIYEDVWGKKTRTEIREMQEEVFWEELDKLRGG